MLFQAKIHERENEGCDGRAGLGRAEGALGRGCWQGGAAELPLRTHPCPGGHEAPWGCAGPQLVPVLAEGGQAVPPSSLCLPFPQNCAHAAITALWVKEIVGKRHRQNLSGCPNKCWSLWKIPHTTLKCGVSTEIIFFKTCSLENISIFPMENAFCPLSIGHKRICWNQMHKLWMERSLLWTDESDQSLVAIKLSSERSAVFENQQNSGRKWSGGVWAAPT